MKKKTFWRNLAESFKPLSNITTLHPMVMKSYLEAACRLGAQPQFKSSFVLCSSRPEYLFRVFSDWRDKLPRAFALLSPGDRKEMESDLLWREEPLLTGEESIFLAAAGDLRFTLLGLHQREREVAIFKRVNPVKVFWSFQDQVFREVLSRLEEALQPQEAFRDYVRHSGCRRQRQRYQNPTPENYFIAFADHAQEQLVELQNKLDLVHAVVKVQEAVTRELDTDRLVEILGAILVDTLHFQLGELLLFDGESKRLRQKALWSSMSSHRTPEGLAIHLEEDLELRVFRSGEPYELQRMPENPYVLNHRLISLLGIRDGLLLPLNDGENGVGLLKLYYSEELQLSPERRQWLKDLARIMSVSLENAISHTRAFELATKDGLTNIPNRRYFEEQFYLELKRSRRYGKGLSVLMLDVDDFKRYNDQNGHLLGDEVLIKVARLIQDTLRGSDIIARYGGEEFMVLLVETDGEQGLVVAEKIRTRIEEAEFHNQQAQPGGNLTVSIGVTQLTPRDRELKDLLARADKALYEAKRRGKNRCIFQA